jgi:FkbM family methyltransferase
MGIGRVLIWFITITLNSVIGLFGRDRQVNARQELCESLAYKVEIEVPEKGILKFHCPEPPVLNRVERIFTKEPATIDWLNEIRDGDILWDVGANIGLYSLLAGLNKNVKVLAFEPMLSNFVVLSKNVIENNMTDRIEPYLIAFSNSVKIAKFNLHSELAGSSGHQLELASEDQTADTDRIPQQSVLSITMDEFVKQFKTQIPTHIKIDVDGIEAAIIQGADGILKSKYLRSILIEINDDGQNIRKKIESANFELIRIEGGNHIFTKIK